MFCNTAVLLATCLALFSASAAQAFRNCEYGDSDAWSAATRYTVSELDFDDVTGIASGTETIYNYSNTYPGDVGECHVTYELSGSYVAGVEVFVLSATRTNFSDTCPPALLSIEYPASRLQSIQIQPMRDDSATVNSGDSEERLAEGSWQPGKAVYKTGERCSIF